jgi:hypothetical protein
MDNFIVAGTRASIKHVHSKFGKRESCGAEIGVFRGQHAQSILNVVSALVSLHLIDPWYDFQKPEWNHTAGKWSGKGEKISGDKIYNEVCQRFKNSKCIVNRAPSIVAVKWFIESELDFVYIDGEHTHKAVLDDLRAWWPIVRKGGVVAGHDYNMPGVKNGVDEFAKEMNVKIQTGYGADFWIDK